MQRREFLIRSGTAAAGLGVISTPAAARTPYESQPDHVTLEFDEPVLRRYRPLLVTRDIDRSALLDLRGWVARSEEFTESVACYWARYASQSTAIRAASHYKDREPIYVFYDERGDVARVIWDGYHYLKDSTTSPNLYTDTDGPHAKLHIARDYRFYSETVEEGTMVDIEDMHDRYATWVDGGWKINRRAVVDPWRMRSLDDWWPDTVGELSVEAQIRQAYLTAGLFGASRSDLS